MSGPGGQRPEPINEREREEWIYEEMLASLRERIPIDLSDDRFGKIPDFSSPTYVPPAALEAVGATPPASESDRVAPQGHPQAFPPRRADRRVVRRDTQIPSRRGQRRVKRLSPMRRLMRMWPVAVALAVVAGLVVVSVAGWNLYRSTHRGGVSTAVSITSEIDAVPVVSLEAPLPLTFAKTSLVTEGSGAVLERDSPVVLRLTVFDGDSGQLSSAGEAPHYLAGRVNSDTLTDDVVDAVLGRRVGSRLALRRPVVRADGQAMEIDVIDILPTLAAGDPGDAVTEPPAVIGDGDEPTLEATAEQPPASAYTQVLRKGTGDQVRDGSSVIANFAVWEFGSHEERTNTWTGSGPRVINLETAMTGLREQLADQRVGSRVLLVLPPELAQGDDTLVIVVDILAVSGDS